MKKTIIPLILVLGIIGVLAVSFITDSPASAESQDATVWDFQGYGNDEIGTVEVPDLWFLSELFNDLFAEYDINSESSIQEVVEMASDLADRLAELEDLRSIMDGLGRDDLIPGTDYAPGKGPTDYDEYWSSVHTRIEILYPENPIAIDPQDPIAVKIEDRDGHVCYECRTWAEFGVKVVIPVEDALEILCWKIAAEYECEVVSIEWGE